MEEGTMPVPETEGSRAWRKQFDAYIKEWADGFTRLDEGIQQSSRALMHGAVDMHCHGDPSVIMRSVDVFEAAVEASAAGMRAIVIKDHHTATYAQAWLANKYADIPNRPFDVFGSIWLNNFAGGYNVYAVDGAINLGARLVSCPTLASPADIAKRAASGYTTQPPDPTLIKADQIPEALRPIETLDENGKVRPEVIECLDRIAEAGNVVFSTGHLGRAEVWAVVRAARERGVERILMTHVQNYTRATAQEIRELCEETGAYAEVITHNLAELEDEAIVALVRGIGPEHVAYGTDAGVLISQKPSVSYLYAVGIMLGAGLIEAEVRRITAQNQALLLDL
jgi:hypothetical protein